MKSTMPAAVVYPQALWDLKREVLIPITIDVQLHGLRVLDTLVWDAAQQQVCAEVFARRMTEELGLPPSFVQAIGQSVNQQLLDFKRVHPHGWAQGTMASAAEDVRQIDIDVRFRSIIYRDSLQWDLSCLSNSPESFARCTVADLALPQEMETAIAFTIHQQLVGHHVQAAPPCIENDSPSDSSAETTLGPHLSHVQPVDQYEFNARDWRNHRPARSFASP